MHFRFQSSDRLVRAFTLLEMLVAISIMAFLIVICGSILNGVNRAWIQGQQQVETFQNGRAILELIARELSQAQISPRLQFIDSPNISALCSNQAPCSSLFWQAPIISNSYGNSCEVGYYLVRSDPTPTSVGVYQLNRFFVAPTSGVAYPYLIGSQLSSATNAPWLTGLTPADFSAASSVVSDGVLAFWVRCFDRNGYPIPWMTTTIKFNSAGYFQPAQPNVAPASNQVGQYPPWTSSGTQQANLLPTSVEVTIVTVDSRTLLRKPAIPSLANYQPSNENDIQNQVNLFNAALIANKIETARTFFTRVPLVNAYR